MRRSGEVDRFGVRVKDRGNERIKVRVKAESSSACGGGDVQAETDYIYGMAPFIHTVGGLMLGASVGGQKFTFEAF